MEENKEEILRNFLQKYGRKSGTERMVMEKVIKNFM